MREILDREAESHPVKAVGIAVAETAAAVDPEEVNAVAIVRGTEPPPAGQEPPTKTSFVAQNLYFYSKIVLNRFLSLSLRPFSSRS